MAGGAIQRIHVATSHQCRDQHVVLPDWLRYRADVGDCLLRAIPDECDLRITAGETISGFNRTLVPVGDSTTPWGSIRICCWVTFWPPIASPRSACWGH